MEAPRTRPGGRGRRRGFTLAEAVVSTAIVAIGVTSLLVATKSGTQVNAAGRDITQATYLAQEVRERTLKLPFSDTDPGDAHNPPGPDSTDPQDFVDDLDDLMGVTYCPPRNAVGDEIPGMDQWSQTIAITWRDPNNLAAILAPGASDVVNVEVSISHQSKPILSCEWIVTRKEQP